MKKENQPKKSLLEDLENSETYSIKKELNKKILPKLLPLLQKKWMLILLLFSLINFIPAIIYYAVNQFFWFILPLVLIFIYIFQSKLRLWYLENKYKKLTKKESDFKSKIEKLKKMNVVLFFVLLLFTSCYDSRNVSIKNTDFEINSKIIYLYILDSCEYFGSVRGSHGDFLTHKGDCKYCLIRNKK